MKTLKICLVILCLLHVRAVGMPQFNGATFYMKQLNLSQGKFAIVDDSDFDFLNQWKWTAMKNRSGSNKHKYYAVRCSWSNGKGSRIYMHRLLMNPKKYELIDHRDGDGLNNQRLNLRKCTRSQNAANRTSIRTKTKTKFLGVTLTLQGKWKAQITKNRVHYNLGDFDSEITAAQVYNNAAIKYHGEFASLNKIEPSMALNRGTKL